MGENRALCIPFLSQRFQWYVHGLLDILAVDNL